MYNLYIKYNWKYLIKSNSDLKANLKTIKEKQIKSLKLHIHQMTLQVEITFNSFNN